MYYPYLIPNLKTKQRNKKPSKLWNIFGDLFIKDMSMFFKRHIIFVNQKVWFLEFSSKLFQDETEWDGMAELLYLMYRWS